MCLFAIITPCLRYTHPLGPTTTSFSLPSISPDGLTGGETLSTNVSVLEMTGAKVNCHGLITFGNSAPRINVSGFIGTRGDDIAEALAGETWEFDVYDGRIIWAKWEA